LIFVVLEITLIVFVGAVGIVESRRMSSSDTLAMGGLDVENPVVNPAGNPQVAAGTLLSSVVHGLSTGFPRGLSSAVEAAGRGCPGPDVDTVRPAVTVGGCGRNLPYTSTSPSPEFFHRLWVTDWITTSLC
jgi:hypothetical protein